MSESIIPAVVFRQSHAPFDLEGARVGSFVREAERKRAHKREGAPRLAWIVEDGRPRCCWT